MRWYALAYIAGILLGWRYGVGAGAQPAALGRADADRRRRPQIDDLILWITLGVILGGRIGYVLLLHAAVDPEQRADLFAHPLEIFEIWHGGMSFHGGAIGVALALIGFARANRHRLLRLADLVARLRADRPVLRPHRQLHQRRALGPADHRALGHGLLQPRTSRRATAASCPAGLTMPRHPSQLYEAALEGVVLFLVLRLATHRLKWLQRPGAVTGLLLIGYGADPHRAGERAQPRRRHADLPARPHHGDDAVDPDDRWSAPVLLWRALRKPPAPAQPQPA